MKNFSRLIIGTILAGAMFATTASGVTITVNSNDPVLSSTTGWSDNDNFIKQGSGKLTFNDASSSKQVRDINLQSGSVEFSVNDSMDNGGRITASSDTAIILGSSVQYLRGHVTAAGNFSVTVLRPDTFGTQTQFNFSLTLGGYILTTPGDASTAYKPMKFVAASTVNNGTFNVGNNRPVEFGAGLTGDFTKTGVGTLLLGGNTSGSINDITAGAVKLLATGDLTGATATYTVGSAGTLDVSAKSGGFTLGSGQTLTGSGTVSGAMTVAGTLAPGSSGIGTLTVGELTMANGASIDWEFLNTGSHDQISGSKLILPASGEKIVLNIAGVEGFELNLDDSFSLFNGEVWLTDGTEALAAGTDITNYFTINDTSGWSRGWKITSGSLVLTAIPEPSSLLLLGLAGLALMRRRRA